MICPSREEADKAINACHNKRTLPGVRTLNLSRLSIGFSGLVGSFNICFLSGLHQDIFLLIFL